jgi:hypothetical protein
MCYKSMKNKKSLMQIREFLKLRQLKYLKGLPIHQLSVRGMAVHNLHQSQSSIDGNLR